MRAILRGGDRERWLGNGRSRMPSRDITLRSGLDARSDGRGFQARASNLLIREIERQPIRAGDNPFQKLLVYTRTPKVLGDALGGFEGGIRSRPPAFVLEDETNRGGISIGRKKDASVEGWRRTAPNWIPDRHPAETSRNDSWWWPYGQQRSWLANCLPTATLLRDDLEYPGRPPRDTRTVTFAPDGIRTDVAEIVRSPVEDITVDRGHRIAAFACSSLARLWPRPARRPSALVDPRTDDRTGGRRTRTTPAGGPSPHRPTSPDGAVRDQEENADRIPVHRNDGERLARRGVGMPIKGPVLIQTGPHGRPPATPSKGDALNHFGRAQTPGCATSGDGDARRPENELPPDGFTHRIPATRSATRPKAAGARRASTLEKRGAEAPVDFGTADRRLPVLHVKA